MAPKSKPPNIPSKRVPLEAILPNNMDNLEPRRALPSALRDAPNPFGLTDPHNTRKDLVTHVFGDGSASNNPKTDSVPGRIRLMYDHRDIPAGDAVQIWSVAGLAASFPPPPNAFNPLGCKGNSESAMFIGVREMLLDMNLGLYGKKVGETVFSRNSMGEMLRVLLPHVKHASSTGLGHISTFDRTSGDNVYLYALRNDPNLYIHLADADAETRSPPGKVWQGLCGMPTGEGSVRYMVKGFSYEIGHSADQTPTVVFHLAVSELTKKPEPLAAYQQPTTSRKMYWFETDALVISCQAADFTTLP